MITYKYQAISKSGEKINGVIEGFNEADAVDRIRENCRIVTSIKPVEEKTGFLNMEIGGNRLNTKAFTMMCSQFAIILGSGVSIIRTVQLIADKTTDKPLKKMLKQVAADVESGRSLAESFAERGKKLLPVTFIETIRGGEESGSMENAFQTMYEQYDKSVKRRAKVRNALIYPIFVLIVAIAVVIVLMIAVVPTFEDIFASLDAELPLITRMLIGIANFFKDYLWLIALVVGVIFVAYKIYEHTEKGKSNLAKIALKIPVFGNIQMLNSSTQFASTMVTMLSSGIALTRAINITSRVIDNYYIGQEIGKISTKLEEGKSLGSTLRAAQVLPDILVDMVAVGEETGEMESTLDTISRYYDAELDMAVEGAIKKLEPTILVFLAGIAGFIVIAMYVAMFSMYNSM